MLYDNIILMTPSVKGKLLNYFTIVLFLEGDFPEGWSTKDLVKFV